MDASDRPAFVPTNALCEFHGEYAANTLGARGEERWFAGCPKCAREREMAGIIGRAAIPPRFQTRTFDRFKVETDGQRAAFAMAKNYADTFEEQLISGRCLLFCGHPGTGKTHLACSILHEIVRKGRAGIYTTVFGAVRRVKDTWSTKGETEREAIASFVKPDLLVLDEVGVQFGSEAEKIILFEIINGRYEHVRPTIAISNLNLKGVEDNIGARVVDRLREGGGESIIFDWESHRKGS